MKGVCWNRPISAFLYLRAIHCRSTPVLTLFQMQLILEMEVRIMTDKEDIIQGKL